MGAVLQFINESGFVGWCIMLVGVAGMALTVERANVLYFKYGMNVDEFMNKIQTLVLARKTDEALVLCAQSPTKPLARAFVSLSNDCSPEC